MTATSSQSSNTDVDGGGGGALAIAWIVGDAKLKSTTDAFIGDRVKIDTALGVDVTATITGAVVKSDLLVGSGGVISIGGSQAFATNEATSRAFIGDGVKIGDPNPVNADVTVTATGRAEADSIAKAYGGGGVQVGIPEARSTVSPIVDAYIGLAGAASPTEIRTKGSIKVKAELLKDATGTVPSDAITDVDATLDTITFSFPGVNEGDIVRYSTTNAIGGLHNGAEYTVLNSGVTGEIRLGSLFDATKVDPLTETITFVAPHGFTSGDCVVYDARPSNSSILVTSATANDAAHGCQDATKKLFFVRVVDQNSIKLATTYANATATDDSPINITAIGANTLTVSQSLNDDQAVIYRAPVALSFTTGVVNVTVVDVTDPVTHLLVKAPNVDGNGMTIHNGPNNIFVGVDNLALLNAGDAVRYDLKSGASIGLASGGTYYVIKGTNGLIQLADSYCHAVGTVGDAACVLPDGPDAGTDPDPIFVTALPLSIRAGVDGGATNGSTTFTSASASFVAGDVGKKMTIAGGLYTV